MKRLTAKGVLMYSIQWLFCSCFLFVSFSKRGTMLLIAIRMSACAFTQFPYFVLIDKRMLNLVWRRYVVANGMSTGSAVSQSLGNITLAEHQVSAKVLLLNYISRARFERNSKRSSSSVPRSEILSKLKDHGFTVKSIFQKFLSSLLQNIYHSTSKWAKYFHKH